jgi:hypothetical protein
MIVNVMKEIKHPKMGETTQLISIVKNPLHLTELNPLATTENPITPSNCKYSKIV